MHGVAPYMCGQAARHTVRRGSRPAPWRADKIPGGYVVRDANGQALAYIYSRDNESEALQAKVPLTKIGPLVFLGSKHLRPVIFLG
jgi:hypothetical protein